MTTSACGRIHFGCDNSEVVERSMPPLFAFMRDTDSGSGLGSRNLGCAKPGEMNGVVGWFPFCDGFDSTGRSSNGFLSSGCLGGLGCGQNQPPLNLLADSAEKADAASSENAKSPAMPRWARRRMPTPQRNASRQTARGAFSPSLEQWSVGFIRFSGWLTREALRI
jgi:hypothetical protein